MAVGDTSIFEEVALNIGNNNHNFASDSFSMILITSLPNINQATPDRTNFTEVTAGGSYSTGGIALTTTYTEVGGVATFDITNAPSWAKLAGSPSGIVAGLIVNDTLAGTDNDGVAFVDFTADSGVTPVSMVDSTINANPHANGLFALTITP